MPCVLWVSCDCSSDELIMKLELKPYKIIEKGSVVTTREGEQYFDHTLCGFDVSKGDFTDFKTLVQESVQWLSEHFNKLSRLQDIEASGKLDYGFYSRFADSKIVAQYDTIPYALIRLASDLKLTIELSQYWYAEHEGAQLN